MKYVLSAILACFCWLTPLETPAHASGLDAGWWVVVGSFPTEPWQAQRDNSDRMQSAAAPCGLELFNDLSGKFRGFKAGYEVFVMGAFESKEIAFAHLRGVRRCFPGAYLKYGQYLGE